MSVLAKLTEQYKQIWPAAIVWEHFPANEDGGAYWEAHFGPFSLVVECRTAHDDWRVEIDWGEETAGLSSRCFADPHRYASKEEAQSGALTTMSEILLAGQGVITGTGAKR